METTLKQEAKIKKRVQLLVFFVSIALLCVKFFAFHITNSAAILTDALESIVNVIAAIITLVSVVLASLPKDKNHPFGHGKIELVSATMEGLMIFVAGGAIIYESIRRIISPTPVENIGVGIFLVIFAGLVNFITGSISIYFGKKYGSLALVAGGKHLHSDSYSTIGMVIGLGLFLLTKILWIDSITALIFGFVILFTGVSILRKSIANITDEADDNELKKIVEIISTNRQDEWINIHNLKLTRYGGYFHMDCDLTLPMFYTISEGHKVYQNLKKVLCENFSEKTEFCIHFDSCDMLYCKYCKVSNCPLRKETFKEPKDFTLQELTAEF